MKVKKLRIEWNKIEEEPSSVIFQVELNRQVVEMWHKRFHDLLAEPTMEVVTMTFVPHLEAPPKLTVSTEITYNDDRPEEQTKH